MFRADQQPAFQDAGKYQHRNRLFSQRPRLGFLVVQPFERGAGVAADLGGRVRASLRRQTEARRP
ncbi:hypothetical protein D9M68_881120 [compost metagenome]